MSRFATSIILDTSYGYQVEDRNDHFVHLAKQAMAIYEECLVPGTFLVDICPWRKCQRTL
jgi:hypothetical protein